MLKKVIVVIGVVLLVGLIVGCGIAKPEAVVKKFFDAAKVQDREAMSSVLSSTTVVDLDTEEESSADPFSVYLAEKMKVNAGKITYKIGKVEAKGEESLVTVTVRYVDEAPLLKTVLAEYLGKAFQLAFSDAGTSGEEMDLLLMDVYKEQDEAMEEAFKEVELEIRLVKEEGKWRISEVTEGLKDVLSSGMYTFGSEMSGVMK